MWDCSKIPVHVSHQIWRDVVCAACACSCCCLIACHRQCSVRFMIPDTVVGFENEMVSAVPVTWVAKKMNWAVQWSEFWAGMRFLDFKLSCIASRRANISWAIRSSSLFLKNPLQYFIVDYFITQHSCNNDPSYHFIQFFWGQSSHVFSKEI